jgi:hypoxanthine phosphoribosyltransferase
MQPQEIMNIPWADYGKLCEQLFDKIKKCGLKFDTVIAISRGGLPLGVYMSHHLHLPLFIISAQCYDKYEKGPVVKICPNISGVGEIGKNILLVDEIYASGGTLFAVKESLRKKIKTNFINTAVLVFRKREKQVAPLPDYHVVEETNDSRWYLFPYEEKIIFNAPKVLQFHFNGKPYKRW